MTKTEIKRAINKAVYQFVSSSYDVDHGEGGGRVYFIPHHSNTSDDMIEYHQSLHYADCSKHADDTIKQDVKNINTFIKTLNIQ